LAAEIGSQRAADLMVALEVLLDAVWRGEKEWGLDDKIAFQTREGGSLAKRRPAPPRG
jgi:hypothetical protein